MARYRKTDVRMYGDEKFVRLTPQKPSGQTLFHYLFTNPKTTQVPGLYSAGEAELAESLGWSLVAFRKHFAEIVEMGMAAADWKARLVWVKNVKRYDAPANANVVRGWRGPIDELPMCPLLVEALTALGEFCAGLQRELEADLAKKGKRPSDSFLVAFREAAGHRLGDRLPELVLSAEDGPEHGSGDGSVDGSGEGSGTPEQEQESGTGTGGKNRRASAARGPSVADLVAVWNANRGPLREVREVSQGSERERNARARLKQIPDLARLAAAVVRLARPHNVHWADFDFFVRNGALQKIEEGKYDLPHRNSGGSPAAAPKPDAPAPGSKYPSRSAEPPRGDA